MTIADGFVVPHPLGDDNADNDFSSTNVVANKDGSIIERLEEIQDKMPITVSLGQAAAHFTGTATKFTVTGIIIVEALGLLITTGLPAGANTLKFSFTPTGGGATDLCGATDTASAAAQQLFLVDGVKATALVKTADVGIGIFSALHMPILLGPGVIQTIYSAGAPATGAGTLFIRYRPLVPGALVV